MEPYSDKVASVWRQVRRFSVEELLELKGVIQQHLDPQEGEGGAGVRELRKPRKPSGPTAAVALVPEAPPLPEPSVLHDVGERGIGGGSKTKTKAPKSPNAGN